MQSLLIGIHTLGEFGKDGNFYLVIMSLILIILIYVLRQLLTTLATAVLIIKMYINLTFFKAKYLSYLLHLLNWTVSFNLTYFSFVRRIKFPTFFYQREQNANVNKITLY